MTQLNPFHGFTPETTNQQIFNQLIDTLDFSPRDVNWLQQWANQSNWPADSTTWANAGNYLDLKSSFDLTGYNATNRDRIKTLLQNIYVAPTTTGGTQ